MSFDVSRFSFEPWNDFLGVVMQQGRVQLDSDWNEWVAELSRRLQAGTMDTLGRAVVPRTTPEGFHILATGGQLTIGQGRIYVDGLLAENHGATPIQWDSALAELEGTAALSFFAQPYLPFNATNQPAPADVFNRPTLAGGPHLVYLDVWQREVTYWQHPDLVEKAVGVDTTGRLQTVWQVKLLSNIGNATCTTPDGQVPGWAAVTRPSGARLTTTTGDVPGDPNPCLTPPAARYKGLENQTYRVEVHKGGPLGTATFKWSRDNATIISGVSAIQGGNRLVVDSVGRDEVLGFHAGEWIEILDDWLELHGMPGLLRRIRPGDGVDAATRSILLEDPLPAGLFPLDAQGRTTPERHTRIRRWDQSGLVRRADGSTYLDLNTSASSDGILIPASGVQLALENGILVQFDLVAGGEFKVGDNWVFAARVADGDIEHLTAAPPRGIHHHYARLAVVTFPDSESDCRVLWPPEVSGESCDCTVCVHAEAHNAGTATIQQAIDSIKTRGGTICLDAGTYQLSAPLNLEGVRSLRIRGQGWMTILEAARAGAMTIKGAIGLAIENLSILSIAREDTAPAISAANCVDLELSHLAVLAVAVGEATSVAVGLGGIILKGAIRDCALVAGRGLDAPSAGAEYLLSADMRAVNNILLCSERGMSFEGLCLHYGALELADNLLLGHGEAGVVATGGAFPAAASVTIARNVLQGNGDGIVAGSDGLRIADNEITGSGSVATGNGIVIDAGLKKGAIDHAYVTGNRVAAVGGGGIVIRRPLGAAMIKSNVLDGIGGAGLLMEGAAGADYLAIENNHLSDLGVRVDDKTQRYAALQLLAVKRGDVANNLLSGVARSATQNPLRAGILAAVTGELRIAANRLFGIGPAEFVGRTVGILVDASFQRLSVEGNSVARVADPAEQVAPAGWHAIVVAPLAAAKDEAGASAAIHPVGAMLLFLKSGILYLSGQLVAVADLATGVTSVRANNLRSQASRVDVVLVDGVRGCLFDQNDAEQTGKGGVLGNLGADHIGAGNNRLVAIGDDVTLRLATKSFAVLGNLTTGPLLVNGSALPAPWSTLNIHI
jgi:Family of unknown function (DUF6519)/Right handed beta helix region